MRTVSRAKGHPRVGNALTNWCYTTRPDPRKAELNGRNRVHQQPQIQKEKNLGQDPSGEPRVREQ